MAMLGRVNGCPPAHPSQRPKAQIFPAFSQHHPIGPPERMPGSRVRKTERDEVPIFAKRPYHRCKNTPKKGRDHWQPRLRSGRVLRPSPLSTRIVDRRSDGVARGLIPRDSMGLQRDFTGIPSPPFWHFQRQVKRNEFLPKWHFAH